MFCHHVPPSPPAINKVVTVRTSMRRKFVSGFSAHSATYTWFVNMAKDSCFGVVVTKRPLQNFSDMNEDEIKEYLEETSKNISLGITANLPEMQMTVTVDAYQINIDDRVVKTGTFSAGDGEDTYYP